MKRSIEITHRECEDWAYELAWKRAGFTNYNKLKQAVRELPLEEKVDLILEALMNECAIELFNRKGEFLRKLGHKTWVDGDEIFEHARETFPSSDDCEFKVDRHDFYPVEIDSDLTFTQLNALGIAARKKETKRNE